MKRRYYLWISEIGHFIRTGKNLGYETLEEAKADALKKVDDALPSNTVRIMQEVAYAYLAGDGGNEVTDIKENDI